MSASINQSECHGLKRFTSCLFSLETRPTEHSSCIIYIYVSRIYSHIRRNSISYLSINAWHNRSPLISQVSWVLRRRIHFSFANQSFQTRWNNNVNTRRSSNVREIVKSPRECRRENSVVESALVTKRFLFIGLRSVTGLCTYNTSIVTGRLVHILVLAHRETCNGHSSYVPILWWTSGAV